MKVVCLSDTHNNHKDVLVPEGDLVIHSGDFTNEGTVKEFREFIKWFSALPHKHKLLCPGNHDFCCERTFTITELICKDYNIMIGWDKEFIIEGTKFFCFPWTKYFGGWAFNAYENSQEDALFSLVNKIPEDTEFLVTHGPPFGILDESNYKMIKTKCGSKALLERIKYLPKLKHCLFGHIHEGYGTHEQSFSLPPQRRITHKVKFINAALAGDKEFHWNKINPARSPFVLEI